MNRRHFLQLTAGVIAPGVNALAFATPALAQSIDTKAILNDPEAPTAGNPKGRRHDRRVPRLQLPILQEVGS